MGALLRPVSLFHCQRRVANLSRDGTAIPLFSVDEPRLDANPAHCGTSVPTRVSQQTFSGCDRCRRSGMAPSRLLQERLSHAVSLSWLLLGSYVIC